jgi:type I restriction enzyme R subunit
MDRDLYGWRPEQGKEDKYGNEVEDRIYNQRDYDKNLVLEKRTELVAEKVTEFLQKTDRYSKSIIFCEDIDHAERMRQAITNLNADITKDNHKYVMRITGDNNEGKAELDNFIDPEQRYPVIATTSKLLSTGVDAQTCKLIVLDQIINSMTEFKQKIGRGTRIREDFGKYYFTIMDFKKATELFADPDFDGEPVQIYEPGPDGPVIPPELEPESGPGGGEIIDLPPPGEEGETKKVKYYIDDVEVSVVREQVQYYGKDGKLITESLKDYTRKRVTQEYESLDDFLTNWTEAEKKQAIIDELADQGVMFEELREETGKEYDAFDLICHVVWGQKPLTRRERAENVKKRDVFTKYGEQARKVLDALLEKYADEGIGQIETMKILTVNPIAELGTPVEIIRSFGSKQHYLEAIKILERELYRQSA